MKPSQKELKQSNPVMFLIGQIIGGLLSAAIIGFSLVWALAIFLGTILLLLSPFIFIVIIIMFMTGSL